MDRSVGREVWTGLWGSWPGTLMGRGGRGAQVIPIARRAWQMEGEGGGECRDVVGMYEDGQECGLGKGSHSPGQCIAPRSLPLGLLPLGHGLWMLLLI